jgi:hypothetical protein
MRGRFFSAGCWGAQKPFTTFNDEQSNETRRHDFNFLICAGDKSLFT